MRAPLLAPEPTPNSRGHQHDLRDFRGRADSGGWACDSESAVHVEARAAHFVSSHDVFHDHGRRREARIDLAAVGVAAQLEGYLACGLFDVLGLMRQQDAREVRWNIPQRLVEIGAGAACFR